VLETEKKRETTPGKGNETSLFRRKHPSTRCSRKRHALDAVPAAYHENQLKASKKKAILPCDLEAQNEQRKSLIAIEG